MNRIVSPSAIAPPAARYAHAVLSEGAGRLLHTAGVVPVSADGSVPDDLAEQSTAVWENIAAILAEAGMSMTDIVSMTTYVVAGQDLAPVMAARDDGDGRARGRVDPRDRPGPRPPGVAGRGRRRRRILTIQSSTCCRSSTWCRPAPHHVLGWSEILDGAGC